MPRVFGLSGTLGMADGGAAAGIRRPGARPGAWARARTRTRLGPWMVAGAQMISWHLLIYIYIYRDKDTWIYRYIDVNVDVYIYIYRYSYGSFFWILWMSAQGTHTFV